MPTNIQSSKKKIRVPCQVYSRIVGYLSATSAWNGGKAQEFKDRVTFAVPENVTKPQLDTPQDTVLQ